VSVLERGYLVERFGDTYIATFNGEQKEWRGPKAKGRAYDWACKKWKRSLIRREDASTPPLITHAEIGKMFDISASRVEQVEVDALVKIRDGLINDPLLIGIMDELNIRTQDLADFERRES